jgi:hypothetical protein
MPSSKSKSNKAEKGCVGIVYGGVLKASKIHIFKHEDTELENFAKNLSQYYGTEFDIKYVPVEDFDDVYEKFLETLDQEQRVSQTPVFNVSISDASKILKEVAEAKACKSFTLKKKEKKAKDDSEGEAEEEEEKPDEKQKKKSSKKSKNDSDGEEEDEEEEKPKKKSSSKKSKNDSEAEEDEEEEKPKKKSSSKKSKNDSEAEEDEEDDTDKKLKKKGKVDDNKTKSKSK